MDAHGESLDIETKLLALARERRPGDPLFANFLEHYYREVPEEDADPRRLEHAYAAALAHLELGGRRARGETLVSVLSPDIDRDGWASDRSLLMFVTDDVPFLVDSVRMVLDRYELGIHLLVHPMLPVRRDADDRIVSIGDDRRASPAVVEAWTQISVDRCTPALAAELEREVAAAIEGVQHVVADFPAMQSRLRELAADDELLDWLAAEQFIFLGAATYDRSDGGLTLRAGSELGEYRIGRLDPMVVDPPPAPPGHATSIARTDAVAHIHRSARMTSIAVRTGADVEHRFVGLLGSGAYRQSVFAIPGVRDRARAVVERSGVVAASHTGRAVRNVIETLPRDMLFELDEDALAEVVERIVGLQERRIVRVFDVEEPVGPWTTVLVYVPRVRFTAELPGAVAQIVAEEYDGEVRDPETLLGSSSLARLSMTVRARRHPDPERLAETIDEATRTWNERARAALAEVLGDVDGHGVFTVVHGSIPDDYRARVRPEAAVGDLTHVADLLDPTSPADGIVTSFGRALEAHDAEWRFRVFLKNRSAAIAEIVPLLEHLGLRALDEHPSTFAGSDASVHLCDVGVSVGDAVIDDGRRTELQRVFVALVRGETEADDLNQLVLGAGLTRRQIEVVRLYARYLRQVGFTFSPRYVEQALVRHGDLTRGLVALFDARFDPAAAGPPSERLTVAEEIRATVLRQLDAIPVLDDDRICRAILTLIDATVRTTAFAGGDELAVKLHPERIPFLPEPRPMFEIFVSSPWVEGVHLRGSRIARGGLRWSDRPEDFRTEVLGLVKAQMVKNAVIVPAGAKGGFVVRQSRAAPGDRAAQREEGVDRYRRFVRALLALTDNVVGGEVVPPPGLVVHDDPDPYLVVAADKGTATFSDIANELAADCGFWLGDAFASGGSNGYDHKVMGITARGAWESVRRHARAMGKDADRDELTVVGIGDMSGDVFGNGMLLSDRLRLVAAFDHRHVFLDPSPDPAVAHAERARLFALPRSSWDDYDRSLISPGGGVHARTLKSVPVTPEVRDALGLEADVVELSPDELISAILRAPVDLLWNGGIGTYVKASTEPHDAVGDRANDAVRVDAVDLRCAMVGEGGNLGFTQLGRVEYAMAGGLINTDAIDNSAGVDCSDHEVNLKILLDGLVRDGDLTVRQRNDLLTEMTDDVAALVLDDNRAQTLALQIARSQALAMVNVHARYLDTLELEGYLDRTLEDLPSDKQIAERQAAGSGLTMPEMAVMIAYTKNADVHEILTTDLPDDPALLSDLEAYFPPVVVERFPDAVAKHRLRREIVATRIVNDMVNLAGISFDHRMTEDSGANVADVTRAFLAARNVLGTATTWWEIDELGGQLDLDTQIAVFLDLRRMTERSTMWLLRHRHPLDIGEVERTFRDGVDWLAGSLDDVVTGPVLARIADLVDQRVAAGVPADLAGRSARWPWMHTAFDIVEVAGSEGCDVGDAARSYWSVFEAFELMWLWDGIGALPRSDRWQQQARSALRDDLMTALADLTRLVLQFGGGSTAAWISANERAVDRALAIHTEIRRAETVDLTTLSVGLRQLRNLTLVSVRS
jgi:glutamate dehydrogenase